MAEGHGAVATIVGLACMLSSAATWAQPASAPTSPQAEPAQQGLTRPAPPGATPQVEPTAVRTKSPGVAFGLSAGTTLAGLALLLVTNDLATPDENGRRLRDAYRTPLYATSSLLLVAGPTTGHVYAGKLWNAGLGIRLASMGLLVIGVSGYVSNIDNHDGGGSDAAAAVFGTVAFAAGLGYIGGTVYEVVTAPRAARRFNARYASPSLAVAPLIAREPGVAVVGRF